MVWSLRERVNLGERMTLLSKAVMSIAMLAIFSACSGGGSSPAASPITPNKISTNPTPSFQPKEGDFSIKENRSRDLGRFVSGQNDAGIFCNLTDVPNSAYSKFINIEAQWTWQNPDTPEKEFFRVRIEAQSPREIVPGKNNFDFVDAQVRLYKNKHRQVTSTEFTAIPQEAYGCDVTNLERVDQKLNGRILCYKNNVYHAYNLRIRFSCTLDPLHI